MILIARAAAADDQRDTYELVYPEIIYIFDTRVPAGCNITMCYFVMNFRDLDIIRSVPYLFIVMNISFVRRKNLWLSK